MARATSTETPVTTAGPGIMFLAIDVSLWDALLRQAEKEGGAPADILSRAVGEYLAKHGTKETIRVFEDR